MFLDPVTYESIMATQAHSKSYLTAMADQWS